MRGKKVAGECGWNICDIKLKDLSFLGGVELWG
jgi:hypothetical protein